MGNNKRRMKDRQNVASADIDNMVKRRKELNINDNKKFNSQQKGRIDVDLEKSYKISCEHGPALYFIRTKANGDVSHFYACSVCRNRKDCDLYVAIDGNEEMILQKIRERKPGTTDQAKIFEQSSTIRKSSLTDDKPLFFCSRCICLSNEKKCDNCGQLMIGRLTEAMLQAPTRILVAKQQDALEGQYWFSKDTLKMLLSILSSFDAVLCIGTPRLFETLRVNGKPTHLLDVDKRLAAFISPKQFSIYNMFAHYFYSNNGPHNLELFLKQHEKMAIVVDPPFGGLMLPLGRSVNLISQLAPLAKTFLVAPYFFERQIVKAFTNDMKLTDIVINYENHKKFNANKTTISPVRLFTNAALDSVRVPKNLGYRHCPQCNRDVALWNRHCNKCSACTSKSGVTYEHCKKCKHCVKPSYQHCKKCDHCHLPKKPCTTINDD